MSEENKEFDESKEESKKKSTEESVEETTEKNSEKADEEAKGEEGDEDVEGDEDEQEDEKKPRRLSDIEDDPTRISPIEYIKNRVQGQIDYFNAKSGQAQKDYKNMRKREFILSALIPVIVTFSSMGVAKDLVFFTVGAKNGIGGSEVNLDLIFQIAAALMGIYMAVLNKVVDLEDYFKRWKDFRVNSEALEHEKHLFMTRSADYDDEDEVESFNMFVDKIESILANDVQRWKKKDKKQEEQQQQQQGQKGQQGQGKGQVPAGLKK